MDDTEAFDIRAPAPAEVILERLGRERYLLGTTGHFRSGWQGRIAWGLANAGLNVVSGFTACDGFGLWRGEIEFDRLAGGSDPAGLDYPALMEADVPEDAPAEISVESAALVRVADYGGSLRLAVRGADSVGFLAALLAVCARAGLHPFELRIRTRCGKVDDLAFLKRQDFEIPSEQERKRLAVWLSSFVG